MHYYIFVFAEEEDCQALASPDLVYGRDEMDDVADESSLCSLDNGIQHAKEADDTDENNDQVGAYIGLVRQCILVIYRMMKMVILIPLVIVCNKAVCF